MVQNKTLDGWLGLYKLGYAENLSLGRGKHESLSEILLGSLPSREDIEMISKAHGQVSIFFHEVSTPESLLEIPGPNAHPTLVARHMLLLATFLQQLHPDVHEEIKGLSEPPRAITKRLANTAVAMVTRDDELVGSIEGLECVMLEATYWLNWGNLRRSLIVLRRAIVIAQLMGLHRSGKYKVLDRKTKAHLQPLWNRVLHCERALCLFVGLPQASCDHSMASEEMLANETPMGRIERIHSVIASRILARNESKSNPLDFTLTQELDIELQKAAKSLPSKWWLTPNLAAVASDQQALFSDTQRLVDQMFHYNLLNLLHLPHMLRASAEHKYDYSKMMCVNSSREMLSRFIMFRSFNRIASSFRVIDFLALIAGMTLLLAHLDSHRFPQSDNLLAHQCISDRAMIEQVEENMVEVGRLNSDALSAQAADLLRRLSVIEIQVADGNTNVAAGLQSYLQTPETETKQLDEDDNRIVPGTEIGCVVSQLCARFELIKLCQEVGISKEMSMARSPKPRNSETQRPGADNSSITNSQTRPVQISSTPADDGIGEFSTMQQPESDPYEQPTVFTGDTAVDAIFAPQFPSSVSDALPQQYQYPELTAGVEDWAFQGVDMAFIDNLMRGAGDDENGGGEWLTWQNQS
jgi:hypothetical protein